MASPKRLTIKYIRIHISKQPTAFLSQLQVLISLPCCFDTGWYVAFLGGVGCIFKEGFGESLNYRVNYSFFFFKVEVIPHHSSLKKGLGLLPILFPRPSCILGSSKQDNPPQVQNQKTVKRCGDKWYNCRRAGTVLILHSHVAAWPGCHVLLLPHLGSSL